MPLNERTIAALGPGARVYRVADRDGLSLEVRPTGSKLWIYRYTFPREDGAGLKRSGCSLGAWPGVKLAEARVRLANARRDVEAGREPARARREDRTRAVRAQAEAARAAARAEAGSAGAVAEDWYRQRVSAGAWGSPRRAHVRRWLDHVVLPAFGDRPLADVTASDVLALVTATHDKHPSKARCVRWVCSQVFKFGILHDVCAGDPTVALARTLPPRRERHHPTLTPEMIAPFLRAARAHRSAWARVALELALLLFPRPSELREAPWAEFDLDGAIWRIPAARMKARRPHVVPLPRQAVALLREWRAVSAGDLVFPSPQGVRADRPMAAYSWQKAVWAIGFKDMFTFHGARGTASTLLRELGVDGELIERQQAHAVGSAVQRAYDHSDQLPARREMMQRWADYLEALALADDQHAGEPAGGTSGKVLTGRFGA